MTDRCTVPRCRGQLEIVYLGHGVCSFHWNRYTCDDQPADALARALGIRVAANAAQEEITMSETKKVETKSAKKKTKAPKEPKAKKERAPKEDLMVFAFRLTKAESAALHKAAGPANASRTMRSLAAAFAAEDPDRFKTVVAEARKLRA